MIKLTKTFIYPCLMFSLALLSNTRVKALETYVQPNQQNQAQESNDWLDSYLPGSQNLTEDELQNIFNNGKHIPSYKEHNAKTIKSKCQAVWLEPSAPDQQSAEWYRAATTLNATKRKTPEEYLQMLTLYEAAARKGHYRAAMQLTIAYAYGAHVQGGYFPAEPNKARAWINYGLRKAWVGSLEWLSTAYHQGKCGFKQNEVESMRFLQLAADKGVALAQYQLGLYYDNDVKDREKAKILFECAAASGTASAANDKWGMIQAINGNPQEALQCFQKGVMAGGQSGASAAWSLASGFIKANGELSNVRDVARTVAYKDLNMALNGGKDSQGIQWPGNPYLKFPRLNEVLPLPPAPMPEWKGVYSAMSEDDAAYYQNPPSASYYIDQVKQSEYLVPKEFLTVFVPTED